MARSCHATYVSSHRKFKSGKYEKFYGWREKRCFAAGVQDALFAWLQDGKWVLSLDMREHEKCYGTVTIHWGSIRSIGSGISPFGSRRRPPFPPCGRWVRPFAKVSPRIASTRR